jgi:hypothetical protein
MVRELLLRCPALHIPSCLEIAPSFLSEESDEKIISVRPLPLDDVR